MVITRSDTGYVLFTELPEIVPFNFGDKPINQGEFAQLSCVVRKGDKPLSITWSLKGDIINSDPTLTTTMLGTQVSMLVISSVDYHHSGIYTCRAENPAGVTTHSAELLVNGNCFGQALESFLYRTTRDCSIHIWIREHRPGKVCSTDMCHQKWRQTFPHHLESEGRHYQL